MLISFFTRSHELPKGKSSAPVRHQTRRAIAAVEVAVLVPFLGALVMGMFELGRAAMVKDIVDNAARKGCNTGIKPGKTYNDIVNDVNDILGDNKLVASQANGLTVQVATYTPPPSPPWTTSPWGPFTTVDATTFAPKQFDQISVKVRVDLSKVLWFAPLFMAQPALDSEAVVMTRQG